MACREGAQGGEHAGSQDPGPLGEPVLADVGEGRGARGHRELVAAEGPRVGAGFPDVEILVVDDDGEREAATDRFGEDHDVRHDTRVVDGPEGARAADARLHLVGDEGQSVRAGEGTHPPQPGIRRRVHTALALDRLDDHPGRVRHPGLRVVEVALGEPGTERGTRLAAHTEGAAVVLGIGKAQCVPHRRGGRRHVERPGGHAVVSAGEAEHRLPARGAPYELERGLDGIGARGPAELDAAAGGQLARQGAEQFGDEGVLDRGREVEDVQGGLGVEDVPDRLEDHGMVVTEGEGARPGEAVQVPAAVRAFDGQTSGPDGDDGQGAGVGPRGRLAQGLPAQYPFLRVGRCDGHGLGHGQGGGSSRGAKGVSGPRTGMATAPVRTNDAGRYG